MQNWCFLAKKHQPNNLNDRMEVVHRQDEELDAMEQVRVWSVNNNNNLGCI